MYMNSRSANTVVESIDGKESIDWKKSFVENFLSSGSVHAL